MRRSSILLIGVLLTASAGCSSSGASSGLKTDNGTNGSEPVELSMQIVAGADEMPGWQAMVDTFNQTHEGSIHVTLKRLPGDWSEYTHKVISEIAAGAPPDIGRLNPSNFLSFRTRGMLVDLKPYLTDMDWSQYYSFAFPVGAEDGKLYGLPEGMGPMAMYYNKTLFDRAGLAYPPSDWSQAWTWDQFENAAMLLSTGTGSEIVYGTYIDTIPEFISPLLWSNGGGEVSDKDYAQVTIQSPETRKALRFIDRLFTNGAAPRPDGTQKRSAVELFKSGMLGLYFNGLWMMPSFENISGFEWGVAPMIRATANQKATTINFINDWVVYKGTKHPKEAAEAVKFFIGGQAENVLVDHNLGGIPVLKSVAEARRKDMFNPLSEKDKDVWLQSIEYAQFPRVTSHYPEVLNELSRQYQLMALGKKSADQIADELAVSIDNILKKQ